MNSKKEYCRPLIKVVDVNLECIIASSYLEEGIGDGGGPCARQFEEDDWDDEW